MLLRKTLVSDRVAGDDCLLGFVSWRDSPRVFMHMRDATVSQKSRLEQGLLLIALYTATV